MNNTAGESRNPQDKKANHSSRGNPAEFSRITRYFCAAAHLYQGFREKFLNEIIYEKYRAPGPYYGVDLLAVAKHCLWAKKRKWTRDLLLFFLFILGVVFGFGGLNVISYMITKGTFIVYDPVILTFIYLGAFVIVFIDRWINKYIIVAKTLSEKSFHNQTSAARIKLDPKLEEEIRSLSEDRTNVTVFSSFTPFVGSGFDIGGWSFVVNTAKGNVEIDKMVEPIPFEVEEMVGFLADRLSETEPGEVRVQERLFVDGKEIRGNKNFLPAPLTKPTLKVSPDIIKKYTGSRDESIRHYTCIHVSSWKCELVLSIFFRLTKVEQNLFLEASYFLLTPLKEIFRQVESLLPHTGISGRLSELQASILPGFFLWVFSPFIMGAKILSPLMRWSKNRQIKKIIKNSLNFDYGAGTTIRESESAPAYRKYFQMLDKTMHTKMFENIIFDGIIEFLDAKNIDTSDLKERSTTILNNGVIVSGGGINAQSITVGKRAKSVFQRLTNIPKSSQSKK